MAISGVGPGAGSDPDLVADHVIVVPNGLAAADLGRVLGRELQDYLIGPGTRAVVDLRSADLLEGVVIDFITTLADSSRARGGAVSLRLPDAEIAIRRQLGGAPDVAIDLSAAGRIESLLLTAVATVARAAAAADSDTDVAAGSAEAGHARAVEARVAALGAAVRAEAAVAAAKAAIAVIEVQTVARSASDIVELSAAAADVAAGAAAAADVPVVPLGDEPVPTGAPAKSGAVEAAVDAQAMAEAVNDAARSIAAAASRAAAAATDTATQLSVEVQHAADRADVVAEAFAATALAISTAGLAVRRVRVLTEQLQLEAIHRDQEQQKLALAHEELLDSQGKLAAAQALAVLGSWCWDDDESTLTVSPQMHAIYGTDPEEPTPRGTFLSLVHPDDLEAVTASFALASATGEVQTVEHRIVRPDGQVRCVCSVTHVGLDERGRGYTRGTVQDVTEGRGATEELARVRDLFVGVLEAATEQSIVGAGPDGLITVFNSGAERMLGYRAEEMLGGSPLQFYDAGELQVVAGESGVEVGFAVVAGRATRGEPETRQWSYLTRDQSRLQVSVTATAMLDPAGDIAGYILVGTDVTRQRLAEAALTESEQRFRVTFDAAPSGMMLIELDADRAGRFLQVNPALSRITGYSSIDLMSMSVRDLTHSEHLSHHDVRFARLLAGHSFGDQVERHWQHADGHDLWVRFSLSLVRGEDTSYLVGQVEDVTAHRMAEERLIHLAFHDELTGLPNRTLFTDRLEHALAASARTAGQVGLLFLDLDGFKAVNDSAGHRGGDHVLVAVAERLRHAVRPGDSVARLGGDEFGVLCIDIDLEEIQAIAERALQALGAPHILEDRAFTVGGSIGVALSGPQTDAKELLRHADAAMYRAKSSGRGRIRLSGSDERQHSDRAMRSVRLESELRAGVERNELTMYGQPVVNLLTGEVVAVETLLRWRHPERGLLKPAEFLDVAEASSVMLDIGSWVLNESCRMASTWSEFLGGTVIPVHVNVSGRQLEAGTLRSDVLDALRRHRLQESSLVLELTETHMPLIANSIRQDLEQLRTQGIHLAIDDLGTGYSSLTRITELPIDMLKIDLSFVSGLGTDRACEAVVRAILGIGQAVGMATVAEGVESPTQAELLHEYGCETAQGYLYSRPLSEHDLLDYLSQAPGGSPL